MATTTSLRQDFEALVRRAEREVAADPAGYRRRLMLLAALGYGVIFSLLTVLIVILGGTILGAMSSSAFLLLLFKKKLILLLILPIWVLVRSLFVRISAPQGYALARAEYPALWAEIDRLRGELSALKIHNVVLTPDMNAAVTQTPRLGLFGPYKNTLILGLELLMSLSPAEARAVLAHEFGHLSRSHGRFGTWIYRKRLTWARIQSAFDEQAMWGMGPIRKFMSWYVPRLAGYSFALARQQEYEADAVASQLTSPEDLGAALVICGTREAITAESFWKPLLRRATRESEPESQTYTRLFEHLRAVPLDRGLARERIAAAMRVKTGFADTHPALKDRLRAIGASAELASREGSAAEAWLGDAFPRVLADFDASWLENNRAAWANRHEWAEGAMARLKELSAKSGAELDQAECWQVAALTEELLPEVDPLVAYRAYRARFPDDLDADFVIGRLMLLENGDPAGIPFMERAVEAPSLEEASAGILSAYYERSDRPELAEHWLRRAEAAYDRHTEARAERDALSIFDTFRRPRLDPELARAVAAAVRASSAGAKVKRIWIAEKVVKHFPDAPVFVVLVKPAFFSRGKDELGTTLAREVSQSMSLSDTWFFLPDISSQRALAARIKKDALEIKD